MACWKSLQTSSAGQATSGHSEAATGGEPHTPAVEQRSHSTSPHARSQQRKKSSTSGAQTFDSQSAFAAQGCPFADKAAPVSPADPTPASQAPSTQGAVGVGTNSSTGEPKVPVSLDEPPTPEGDAGGVSPPIEAPAAPTSSR